MKTSLLLLLALALSSCSNKPRSSNEMIAEGDRNPTVRMGERHAGGEL